MPDLPGPADAPKPPAHGREAWLRALTELEASLGMSANGIAHQWVAPGALGPLPPDLAPRARALLDGQRELIAELGDSQRTTAAHLAALRTVPTTGRAGASVYLDTSG